MGGFKMAASDERSKSDRRAFLQQCGRFAVVTPPVVSLMLSVSDKALAESLATSGKTKTTTTTECPAVQLEESCFPVTRGAITAIQCTTICGPPGAAG